MLDMWACCDICTIPYGPNQSSSVANEIAIVLNVIKSSNLTHQLHGHGTNFEGPIDKVLNTIELIHKTLHENGVTRITSDIRISTRTDKQTSNKSKIEAVENILNK